jgi:hypothetical protein
MKTWHVMSSTAALIITSRVLNSTQVCISKLEMNIVSMYLTKLISTISLGSGLAQKQEYEYVVLYFTLKIIYREERKRFFLCKM